MKYRATAGKLKFTVYADTDGEAFTKALKEARDHGQSRTRAGNIAQISVVKDETPPEPMKRFRHIRSLAGLTWRRNLNTEYADLDGHKLVIDFRQDRSTEFKRVYVGMIDGREFGRSSERAKIIKRMIKKLNKGGL